MPVSFIPSPTFESLPAKRTHASPRPRRNRAKPKKKTRRRTLTRQEATTLDDRVNEAIESGVIDLHDDFEKCEFLDLTHGELELLMRILSPGDEAAVEELRKRLAKRKTKG